MADEQQALIIIGGVMTGAAVITGPWVKIKKSVRPSFQAKWTGTPTGLFSFEVSNDENPNAVTGNNLLGASAYVNPTVGPLVQPVGAAGNWAADWGASPPPYVWIRPKYTNSGGAGVLNMGFCGKGGAG